MKLLGNKRLVTVLLFRGSQHGWEYKHFHSRCDNKGPTITLFKVKDGDCIGGFTTAQWLSVDGGSPKFNLDSDSFLFNLSSSRHFPNTGKGGIRCRTNIGPSFGNADKTDFNAWDDPFNGNNKCASMANCPGFCIGLEGGKNMLTNQKNGRFTISEMEVWEVTFIVNNYII